MDNVQKLKNRMTYQCCHHTTIFSGAAILFTSIFLKQYLIQRFVYFRPEGYKLNCISAALKLQVHQYAGREFAEG
jgi:hypothetical protein